MMRPRKPMPPLARLSLTLISAAVLAACGSKALKDTGPSIKTLSKQDAPTQEELPIVLSAPVAASPELALENYRAIMNLAPDPQTRAEAMRRMADLQLDVRDLSPGEDGERLLGSSIKLYEELLAESPEDSNNDRVIYQLARAYQNSGQEDLAIQTLQRLAKQHPDSSFVGDGRFRRAEMLFQLARYDEAGAEYKRVLELGDATPFFENSQYKYGWSLYKQGLHDESLDVFFTILDRELPPGELVEPETALAQVASNKRDLTASVIKVTGLALTAMGGGPALGEALSKRGEPRFYVLLYNALGSALLEKQRYTDAAGTYAAFTQRYPSHPLAPRFQSQLIQAYADGGFSEQVVEAKAHYARTYDPDAEYWGGAPMSDEVRTALRGHLEDLARYHHAAAPEAGAQARERYLAAAGWYQRLLEVYPSDPAAPELNFLFADALLDGGETARAAEQYTRTAYDYPAHDRSAEAAYAAVLAYQSLITVAAAEQRLAAVRTAVDSGVRFADNFGEHPQVLAVLTRSAEDLYQIESYDEAIQIARRVAQHVPPADPALQRIVWGVIADAEFTQQRFDLAENAYSQLLLRVPAEDAKRVELIERLATSVYKQGEAARAAGELRTAVSHFLRLSTVTPTASIRPNSEYDAAAVLIELEDWNEAARVLEAFRLHFPQHALVPDGDKRLASVYEKAGRPADAAGAYQRIAGRLTESIETRQAAAWRAGELYDEAGQPRLAAAAWEIYVNSFPQPLDDAMDARERLVQLAQERGDQSAYRRWLDAIVNADQNAGPTRTDRSRSLAAESALTLGRLDAADAASRVLTLPIKDSLPPKRAALQQAIRRLDQAAGYGFAEVTTAATYALGDLYRDFARDLIDSERPRNLNELELEQYELLLEEQAFPFEEQAIGYHETNLKRIANGIYDQWVRQSYLALEKMVPGQYAKNEQQERVYESLR